MTSRPWPPWFDALAEPALTMTAHDFAWQPMPDTEEARAAVLVLFCGNNAPEVLLIERPSHMRSHAGQPAFPGGRIESGESARQAALREAHEEVGLDPSSVDVVCELPELWLPPSRFKVTPVLAWWSQPHALHGVNSEEVSAWHQVPVAELVDPRNRVRVRTRSGHLGPAFAVRNMLVWGFTAGVLSRLFDVSGWVLPWDDDAVVEMPRPDDQVPS